MPNTDSDLYNVLVLSQEACERWTQHLYIWTNVFFCLSSIKLCEKGAIQFSALCRSVSSFILCKAQWDRSSLKLHLANTSSFLSFCSTVCKQMGQFTGMGKKALGPCYQACFLAKIILPDLRNISGSCDQQFLSHCLLLIILDTSSFQSFFISSRKIPRFYFCCTRVLQNVISQIL